MLVDRGMRCDASGSMVSRGTQAVRYDAERRPVRVNDGATLLWRASYDGDGARRKRVDGKGTVHYLKTCDQYQIYSPAVHRQPTADCS